MTVFTIGYADKTVPQLLELMRENKITLLVDVRTRPFSRMREFNRSSLERVLGKRYLWEGERLGGLSGVREEGYEEGLKSLVSKSQTTNICVMCMESDPNQCHRKMWIAADLLFQFGVQCKHL